MSNSDFNTLSDDEEKKVSWVRSAFAKATCKETHASIRASALEKRKHITKGLQTATALGVIFYHAYTKNPQKARGAIIRVASNSAWFAYATKKFPVLKTLDEEKFILGLSVVGMALSAPQLYGALVAGNFISQALSMAAIAAFSIRMVPPVEKFVREGTQKSWSNTLSAKFSQAAPVIWTEQKFSKLGKLSDKFVNHHSLTSKFFKHSPSVIVGLTGLIQTAMALTKADWPGVATGLASLFGTGMLVAAEFGMKDKQEAVEPSIFDPIEPVEEKIEDVVHKASNDNSEVGENEIELADADLEEVIPESAHIETKKENGVERDVIIVSQTSHPPTMPAPM